MRRITIITLTVILVLIPIVAINCDSDEGNDIVITTLPEGFTWYQKDELGFKIAYPEDWWVSPGSQDDEGGYHVRIRESFPPNPSITGGMISVGVVPVFDISDLEDDAESKEEVLINGREGLTFIGGGTLTIIGGSDDDIVYTVKNSNTVLEINDKYYIITCSCLKEVWDEKVPTFDTAIMSFIIG